MWCQVMWCHVRSCYMMWCDVRWCDVRSGQVESGRVRSGQVRSYHVIWYDVMSGHVMSGHVMSGQVMLVQVRSSYIIESKVVLYIDIFSVHVCMYPVLEKVPSLPPSFSLLFWWQTKHLFLMSLSTTSSLFMPVVYYINMCETYTFLQCIVGCKTFEEFVDH